MKKLNVDGEIYSYFSIKKFAKQHGLNINKMPFSTKIMLENLIRNIDEKDIFLQDVIDFCIKDTEVSFMPAIVLMQDFTGVPAVVDLAAMRDEMSKKGEDPGLINPLVPAHLIIDHSIQVDYYKSDDAKNKNIQIEFERNKERYEFLKWGQSSFSNFQVIPSGYGICHQINLEYLAKVVWIKEKNGENIAYFDTLIGTDSHTTMINGIGILGWGVGGIEAEAVMLNQPILMTKPKVVGFKLKGKLNPGTTATDAVLTITNILRKKGVVNKFVEFFGEGVLNLTLPERATIANMAPEYGATCGIFPIDQEVLNYLKLTNRSQKQISLVREYAKSQDVWFDVNKECEYDSIVELDLSEIKTSLAGPKRPQDLVELKDVAINFDQNFTLKKNEIELKSVNNLNIQTLNETNAKISNLKANSSDLQINKEQFEENKSNDYKKGKVTYNVANTNDHSFLSGQTKDTNLFKNELKNEEKDKITHGSIVIAAITSCTNTSNPYVLIGAGLLAKKAVEAGLKIKSFVKTSLAPGSRVVTDYLVKSGLYKYLAQLGFNIVGYGCTTCIGNSGPLLKEIEEDIKQNDYITVSVLSGNRNFEGRIHPLVQANYLASPALVVAYALSGNIKINITSDPIGQNKDGKNIFLKDIWPKNEEISSIVTSNIDSQMFKNCYEDILKGDQNWQKINSTSSKVYNWPKSTYIENPPYFTISKQVGEIKNAKILAVFGDSITTDHISPAGDIALNSPAGAYLIEKGIKKEDFNSYGARRGSHSVMMRGTFANPRIKNELIDLKGGFTLNSNGEIKSIFEVAMQHQDSGFKSVIFAGKEYGTGSSRDWAAKGTRLLGIAAVIAESFERIHRSNLVGMGVLPLEFTNGENRHTLNIINCQSINVLNIENIKPKQILECVLNYKDTTQKIIYLLARLDTLKDIQYYLSGGIFNYVTENIKHF